MYLKANSTMKPTDDNDKMNQIAQLIKQSESIEIDPESLAFYEPSEPKTRYEANKTGIYFVEVKTAKDGTKHEQAPLRLSDYMELVGRGLDQSGNHYRVLRWQDYLTNQTHTIALPMAEIGSNWAALTKHGLTVHSSRYKRELLADYLQTHGEHTPYTITNKSGWHGNAYVLPNGEVINNTSNNNMIYNGDTSESGAYLVSGSLKDWQENVARYAAGNSRLCLAIGTALAAPLLAKLNEQNGGFHIYGDSSDGKTTAALVALSVFGNPQTLKMTWRGTDLGFSNAALARNDSLLVLDEIGEAQPKTISKTAYSVINGKSKLQGAKDGGNREKSEWRILLLSTGEKSLQNYMTQAGEKWEAGQAVRLPSIPAVTRYGIYENLHDFQDGATLSEHLQIATQQQYGAAGRAWLEQLANTPTSELHAAQNAFMATLPQLDGQARRVARRFAIVAAALELAANITGLPCGVGLAGVKQCFDDWFVMHGDGKHEDRQIIEQAQNWIDRNGQTDRLASLSTVLNMTGEHNGIGGKDYAGFRAMENGNVFLYIIPPVFKDEIAQSYEVLKAVNVLAKHGILIKETPDGQRQIKRETLKEHGLNGKRFYKMRYDYETGEE